MLDPDSLPDDFYDRVRPRLFKRIGREIRLARHVIDFGCGSCELVKYLAETYHQDVTGVDIAPRKFPRGRRTAVGRSYHCLNRDAAHLKKTPAESVDVAVMVWALHEMNQPEAVLMEVHRVLRPGGKILIVDFPKDSLASRLWNEQYYAPDIVKGLLTQAGYDEVKVRLIEQGQVIFAGAHRPPARN